MASQLTTVELQRMKGYYQFADFRVIHMIDELLGLRELAEARLVALRQYAGHHSSCDRCYPVWREVQRITEAASALKAGESAKGELR